MNEYFDRELNALTLRMVARSPSLVDLKNVQCEETPKIVHDLWSAYCYGDIIKIVYIKKSANKKIPLSEEEKEERKNAKKRGEGERFSQSLSRSKSRVFELAMCNEFKYFCTFTQNKELRDRFDINEFRKDFSMLVRNLNRTRVEDDKIKYLLIPEKHKKGAWHMHGLLQGLTEEDLREFTLSEKLPYKIRNQLLNGEKVYNWEKYSQKFGFFTCTEVKNGVACSKYITKYITKDLQKNAFEEGRHLFFASQGLRGRETLAKNSAEKCPVESLDFENEYIKIKEIRVSEISDSGLFIP